MPDISKAKRVHVAIAVADLEAAIEEYTARLGVGPVTISANGEYALFLTPILNLSVSEMPNAAGKLRHLGFEDDSSPAATVETDSNGFIWEHFTLAQQAEEILERWPDTDWSPRPGQ